MGNCFACLKSGEESSGVTGSNTGAGETVMRNEQGKIRAGRLCLTKFLQDSALTEPYQTLLAGNQQVEAAKTKASSLRKVGLFANGTTGGMQEVPTMIKDSQMSDNALNKLFEEYKDPSEDAILSEGIERLCRDLEKKPDDFAILVLAWCLDAAQMCCFTKAEFIQGLQQMNASSIPEIKLRLQQTIDKLAADSELFKQLYRFTFRFGLETGHRILSLDMAIILWRLVFTIHSPDILERWLNFLDQNPTIRGIPKDTWNMFLNFAESCDITQYDADEAWPSLFDDFVEYENDRLNQNVSVNKVDTTES